MRLDPHVAQELYDAAMGSLSTSGTAQSRKQRLINALATADVNNRAQLADADDRVRTACKQISGFDPGPMTDG